MMLSKFYVLLFVPFVLSSLGNDERCEFTDITEVFGFYGQNRYSYCPSLVKEDDGTVHMFFCGNPTPGIMVDNIYHIRINPDGTKTSAKSVLQPGPPGSWDDHHTCDPSVIAGEFRMGGQKYKYAMFFLTNKYGVYYNEIGVAFSNQLDADHWIKFPELLVTKTWVSEGDQPLGSRKSWGVGQPSAVSLDNKGKALLTYTIGDIEGTRIVWTRIDMSDMNAYSSTPTTTMITTGLRNINSTDDDVTCNADFATCPSEDMIVMVRPLRPHDTQYPSFINTSLEVNCMKLSEFLASTGKWTSMLRITPVETNFPRNHNAGIERDIYGRISSWKTPVVYFTVSKAAPDVNASTDQCAEWTYHIYKGVLTNRPCFSRVDK